MWYIDANLDTRLLNSSVSQSHRESERLDITSEKREIDWGISKANGARRILFLMFSLWFLNISLSH